MKIRKFLTINVRFVLLGLIQLFLVIFSSYFLIWGIQRLSKNMEELIEKHMILMESSILLDMEHDHIRSLVYSALYGQITKNGDIINETVKDISESKKEVQRHITSLVNTNMDQNLKSQSADVIGIFPTYMKLADKIIVSIKEGVYENLDKNVSEFNKIFKDLEQKIGDLSQSIEKNSAHEVDKDKELIQWINKISLALFFLTLLVIIVASFIFSKNINGVLRFFAKNLVSETKAIGTTAESLNKSAENLSRATQQQASALQETAASIDEISAMIRKTSENSSQLDVSSQKNYELARDGQKSVGEMLKLLVGITESNKQILNQVEEGNGKISEIVKVISEIGAKTKVINDIVFQTKLLSFNASVEAARAGEHGKGFAVVAEEVGNLAQMSGNAAKEISEMLSSSIQKVEFIVVENKKKVESLLLDGRSNLDSGKVVANQVEKSLEQIVTQSLSVTSLISEITTAIREQNQGVEEISKAISLLDKSTHQNSKISSDTFHASENLISRFKSLYEIISNINLLVSNRVDKNNFNIESVVKDNSTPIKNNESINLINGNGLKKIEHYSYKKTLTEDYPNHSDNRFDEL